MNALSSDQGCRISLHPLNSLPSAVVMKVCETLGSLSEKAGSWSSLISNPSGYDVSLEREISEEDFEELSVAERKLLDEIWGKYGGLDEWELVDLLHDVRRMAGSARYIGSDILF